DNGDAFVAKFSPTGALLFSTFLGGAKSDYSLGIALDSQGNIYTTGFTQSTDLPATANAFQQHFGAISDGFVAKLDNSGGTLLYLTYLGGPGQDQANAIAVDTLGNAYVTGSAAAGFPTKNAIQPNAGSGSNAFVTKINPAGSALVY